MLDINSELDELDREEFYRLKKVLTSLFSYFLVYLLYISSLSFFNPYFACFTGFQ